MIAKCLYVLFLILIFKLSATAQFERYELGKRLQRLESELEVASSQDRKAAFSEIRKAVDGFFTFRFSDVAKNLDKAYLTLKRREDKDSVWAESLSVTPEYRLIDRKNTKLKIELSALYSTVDTIPQKAIWRLTLMGSREDVIRRFRSIPINSLPSSEIIDLEKIKHGDYYLKSDILIDDKVLSSSKLIISISDNLEERLKRLEEAAKNLNEDWKKETVIEYLKILQRLKRGETLETDFRANELLKKAEIIAFKPAGFQIKSGLIAIPLKDGVQVSRILLPENYTETKSFPLVIALHGAGGSENLFFESYGNGKIVRLCQKRGWILVASRNFGFKATKMEEFIDALSKIYKIDKNKVFLIGHSLGSIQALAIASEKPELFKAIALISAGGSFKNNEQLKELPIFIATGTADFSFRSSKNLEEKMVQAGFKKVKFVAYEDVEHLTAVQFSLDEIFSFFDDLVKSYSP